jgi:hypothetical protein
MRKYLLPVIPYLISCGSIVPLDYDKIENNYQRLTIENDYHTIHMASLESQYQHLVFDVEIINNTSDTIVFDPVSIVYYGSHSPFPISYGNIDMHELTRPNATDHKSYPATSPEIILAIDEAKMIDPAFSSTLRNELLYDCEILPGERYYGKVFFYKPQKFRYFRFVTFLGRTDYVFDFRLKGAPIR